MKTSAIRISALISLVGCLCSGPAVYPSDTYFSLSPFVMATRGIHLEHAYAPILGPSIRGREMDAQIHKQLQYHEIMLARDLNLPFERLCLAIDFYLRPAYLMKLAVSGQFRSVFEELPLTGKFISQVNERLAKIVPSQFEKFLETYAPANDMRGELRRHLGFRSFLQSKPLLFEFEGMHWMGWRKGQYSALIDPAAQIVGNYVTAIRRVQRGLDAFGRLPPKSDLVQTGLIMLDHANKSLQAELADFPRRFEAYARFESPGRYEDSLLNKKWRADYAENMRLYSENPLSYVCALALKQKSL